MKFVSWNVNGLRAALSKGLEDIIRDFDADFFCLQETKIQEGQADLSPTGYNAYYDYAERKGYSGTATLSRKPAQKSFKGIGKEAHDREGRVVTLDMGDFYLVNVYTPNSQSELARLHYRMQWEEAFSDYVSSLDREKPVIICGDLNVAHQDIDLTNPKTNRQNPGFTDQERNALSRLLSKGFVDTFRYLHPDQTGAYSWWSYRYGARAKNIGWRIDYFLVSERLAQKLISALIHPDITGSDHCPVSIEISWRIGQNGC